MKKKKYTTEQIIGILKEADASGNVSDVCRKHGIANTTYYGWKAKYGNMERCEATQGAGARELPAQAAAGRGCARQRGAQRPSWPKVVSSQARREAVGILMAERQMGVTRACGLVGISRSLLAYRSRRQAPEGLRERIGEIAATKRRYGYRRVHVLLRREGWQINHKRMHRLYREAGLQVRKRARKRIVHGERTPLQQARRPNESWSMDFVADALANGRRIRCLALVDNFTKESLAIVPDTSITGLRVARELDQVIASRGAPDSISVDNGPEFAGRVLDEWAYRNNIGLRFIRPGKPVENAYVESFNGQVPRRVLERALVCQPCRGSGADRGLASRVQPRAAPQLDRQRYTGRIRRSVAPCRSERNQVKSTRRLRIKFVLNPGGRSLYPRCNSDPDHTMLMTETTRRVPNTVMP